MRGEGSTGRLVRGTHEGHQETWDDPARGRLGFRTLFASEHTPTATLTSGVADLPVDGRLEVHRHDPAEVYYCLSGEGVVTLDGDEHPVSEGSAVFIPGGLPHGVRNTGPSVLRIFYVLAADGMGDVEYDFSPGPARS
jgi:mannose-6-phosphate isomerase-like protein (cupin superfamily)